jgi:hypothetical protein
MNDVVNSTPYTIILSGDKMSLTLMLSCLQTLGSLFVNKSKDGKTNLNALPIAAVLLLGNTVGCMAQDDEPFSTCVVKTTEAISEGLEL